MRHQDMQVYLYPLPGFSIRVACTEVVRAIQEKALEGRVCGFIWNKTLHVASHADTPETLYERWRLETFKMGGKI